MGVIILPLMANSRILTAPFIDKSFTVVLPVITALPVITVSPEIVVGYNIFMYGVLRVTDFFVYIPYFPVV